MMILDTSNMEVWKCESCQKYNQGSCYKIIENLINNDHDNNLSTVERKSCLVGNINNCNKPLFIRIVLPYLDITNMECCICNECKNVDKPCYIILERPNKFYCNDYIKDNAKKSCLFGDLHKANFDKVRIYDN
jgi:hypothetical protein